MCFRAIIGHSEKTACLFIGSRVVATAPLSHLVGVGRITFLAGPGPAVDRRKAARFFREWGGTVAARRREYAKDEFELYETV